MVPQIRQSITKKSLLPRTTRQRASSPPRPRRPRAPKPDTGAQAATKPKGHGRLPASDYPDATHITVAHESLSPGDICPACGRGKLYALKEPARFLRIRSKVGLGNRSLENIRAWPTCLKYRWNGHCFRSTGSPVSSGQAAFPAARWSISLFLNRQEPPNL